MNIVPGFHLAQKQGSKNRKIKKKYNKDNLTLEVFS